ncbi:antimicrobial peptide NK-lysin [Erinaceus europaeus]|uniref:Antimicrobial peptide NK-lysin n=1 Tax=Erinaceus europaeus TaxID=9365 RepID=A0A1S3A600_ERIEU|nr:antimicrobial peptide NK-lysin [Erinaceus europaeus]
MSAYTLLLLASALLVTPGLAFSGVDPEPDDSLLTLPCGGKSSCTSQSPVDLPSNMNVAESISFTCRPCRMIIDKLRNVVGEEPNEDTISQAKTRVCNKLPVLKGLCKKIMGSFFHRIARDIIAGKSSQDVCVDIKMCKSKAGLN